MYVYVCVYVMYIQEYGSDDAHCDSKAQEEVWAL